MFTSIIWSVNITFLYLHYFSLFYIKARLMHLYILRFVDPASLHKNEPHAQFVFSIFRRTCTCFGRNYSPSSGGTPYGYNNWYLLFFLDDPARTTDNHLKRITSTNCYILTVYVLMMGYR